MSIAMMNWVWPDSPTSGDERLPQLALADACSGDDGTGCWSSATAITRMADISERAARRVIAGLEIGGRSVVHCSGGEGRPPNTCTVVTEIGPRPGVAGR